MYETRQNLTTLLKLKLYNKIPNTLFTNVILNNFWIPFIGLFEKVIHLIIMVSLLHFKMLHHDKLLCKMHHCPSYLKMLLQKLMLFLNVRLIKLRALGF